MKLFTQAMYKTLPWKNGGGVTTELFVTPQGLEFNLRLSMARIDKDGPFSLYAGYDRHLLILEGSGIDINVNVTNRRLSLGSEAFFFPGEAFVSSALLSGPVTDFNVMIKRDWGKATVKTLRTYQHVACSNDYLYIFDFKNMELRELSNGEECAASADSITVDIILFNE